MQKEREKNWDDNPTKFYDEYLKRNRAGRNQDGGNEEGEKRTRPLTIFEEIDMMKERKKTKQKTNKYDRSMVRPGNEYISLIKLHLMGNCRQFYK